MNKDQLIEYLIKAKAIVKVKEEYYVIDKKLGISIGAKCQNLPDKYNNVTVRQQFKLFINDCEIPDFCKGNFVYLLREETKESLAVLSSIIDSPEIDFSILIKKVKSYYKLMTGVKPIKNLLSEGTWRTVYESNLESKADVKLSNETLR